MDYHTFPLSFEQERMWVLHQLQPTNPAHHIYGAIQIKGKLDRRYLQQAIKATVQRHDSLRTCFKIIDGQPRQIINAMPVEPVLLEQQSQASEVVIQPFDLAQGTPWRMVLLPLDATLSILVLSAHHIILDGDVSMRLLFSEVWQRYVALLHDQADPFAALCVQYKDYTLWQRQQFERLQWQAQLDYWRPILSDNTPLQLPITRSRTPLQSYAGASKQFHLSQSHYQRLQQLQQEAEVDEFTLLLAIFTTLLYRYSHQHNITIGTPAAGRHYSGTEALIGYFGNPLVLVFDCSQQLSFLQLLAHVDQVLQQAKAQQDYPFQKIVEAIQPQRDSSATPLFQVLFVVEQTIVPDIVVPGLTLTSTTIAIDAVAYDLCLFIQQSEDELIWHWHYNSDLFDADIIDAMLRHCQTLMASIVDAPEQNIDHLALLSSQQQQHMLIDWNDTQCNLEPACIHHWIEQQVLKTPDAIALIDGQNAISYYLLNMRANQLAHYLIHLDVQPETLVGIYLERSAELMIAILAVLKAGGAYLPLDISYPTQRLAFMLTDAKPHIVLTTQTLLAANEAISLFVGQTLVYLDHDHEAIDRHNRQNPVTSVEPHHLLYVLYTSGSTGQPKGVAMEHRAIVNMLNWHRRQRLNQPGMRVLQFAPISFDVSFHEISAAWCHGGTLVVMPDDLRRDIPMLLQFITQQQIHKLFVPFVALQQIAEGVKQQALPMQLGEIICAGEQLQMTPAVTDFIRQTQCQLHNHYGGTECMDSVAYTLDSSAKIWPNLPPVGRPIDNAQVYILDKQRQLVPPGVIGEIYIAGACLARGYYKNPQLTASRFIENPFGTGKLYRIGDLGRYLTSGDIECLGREDKQVKIRGFTVELAEIETLLQQDAMVKVGIVVAREDIPGQNRLVAYIVAQSAAPSDTDIESHLRLKLKQALPDYMLPAQFVMLDKLPLTPSGKVDRRHLPDPQTQMANQQYNPPKSILEQKIAEIWQSVLQQEQVSIDDHFFERGGNSLHLLQVGQQIEKILQIPLSISKLFQYPTIRMLAQYMSNAQTEAVVEPPPIPSITNAHQSIAIIGMSGRFPGAQTLAQFWQNLQDGVESITFYQPHELAVEVAEWHTDPNYVMAGAPLSDIAGFDADFFGYSPKEAEQMDPQQRLFLECAWEAMEDAGYCSFNYPGDIGVYAGSGLSTYLINQLYPQFENTPLLEFNSLPLKLGNEANYLPSRVAYKLNLTGPSVNVQTACSTSLVAVHMACQSLLLQECDMALAGGVAITVPQATGYRYEQGMIHSPDGHSRVFDAQAQGTVFGNGVGVVLLKRLQDAVADGDDIYAVIKGSAINNDGAHKVGYTAPSVDGQSKVVSKALSRAKTSAETISYIEAHGTATPLGDPIEVAALDQAFRQQTQATHFCALGSVKSNIGHLDEAAGIAGLIKTVLALKHQMIPPSLHFDQPNPNIDFANSAFYVNTVLRPWQSHHLPRRAGVSSFGMGGNNCHVVLEEAMMPPQHDIAPVALPSHLLTLSAKNSEALHQLLLRYEDYLKQTPDVDLLALCFTANVGRADFTHRIALTTTDTITLQQQLQSMLSQRIANAVTVLSHRPKIAFLLTGQGAQYPGMGYQLYQTYSVFQAALDRCDEILQSELDCSIVEILATETRTDLFEQASIIQPLLFSVEYALVELWRAWGIQPDYVMGHSLGEYVAACVAGVFSLETGLKLVAARGRLMQSLPQQGQMIYVAASIETVNEAIAAYPQTVSIAAINGPDNIVISGEQQALQQIGLNLKNKGIQLKTLAVSHAFHSPLMEPMLAAYQAIVESVTLSTPQIPIINNVSGQQNAEISTASYWCRHVRQPVQFMAGILTLNQQAIDVWLEIGPKPVLLPMAKACLPQHTGLWLPSLVAHQHEQQAVLQSLAQLYQQGVDVNWHGFHQDDPYQKRIHLPTYPFQHQDYWAESSNSHPMCENPVPSYHIDWRAISLQRLPLAVTGTWIIIADRQGLGQALKIWLQQQNQSVVIIQQHDMSQQLDQVTTPLAGIVHLSSLDTCAPAIDDDMDSALDHALNHGCGSVWQLVQYLLHHDQPLPALWLVTRGTQAINDQANVTGILQSPLWGLAKSLRMELPELDCILLDMDDQYGDIPDQLEQLVSVLEAKTSENQLAWRHHCCYVPRIISDPSPESVVPLIFESNASYLITGGLNGLGLSVARWMVELGAKQLVLLGRHQPNATAQIEINALKQLGADICIMQCPVDDRVLLSECVSHINSVLPPLRGVIHAAGVIEFGTVGQQSWQQFSQVLRPKFQGTWNLHQLTQPNDLSFFICFSSIAAVLGSYGLASYAAANAFMDSFAHYRHGLNLPACSINWGPWGQIGMTERFGTQHQQQLNQLGLSEITPMQGLATLKQALQNETVQPVAVLIDWAQWCKQFDKLPLFLAEVCEDTSSIETAAIGHHLDLLPVTQRQIYLRDYLCRQIAQLLGLKSAAQVPLETPFIDFGLDSLAAIELRHKLQSDLGCSLKSTFLFDYPTLNQLMQALLQNTGTATSNLVPIQPRGEQQPIFCVPGILGDVVGFSELAFHLGNHQPLYGLPSYGLDEEVAPYDDICQMAALHIKSIKTVQAQGPYRLGGHSFGGKVAFEIARQLVVSGEQVSSLLLWDASALITAAEIAALQYTEAEWLDQLAEFYQAPDLPIAIIKANNYASSHYTVNRAYDIPITLFRAQALGVLQHWLPDAMQTKADPSWGWQQYSTQNVVVKSTPGNHFTLLTKPNVKILANECKKVLSMTQQSKDIA